MKLHKSELLISKFTKSLCLIAFVHNFRIVRKKLEQNLYLKHSCKTLKVHRAKEDRVCRALFQ